MNKSLFLVALFYAISASAQQQAAPQLTQPLPSAEQYQQALSILKGDSPSAATTAAAKPTRKTPAKPATKRSKTPDLQGSIDSGSVEVYRQVPLPANAKFGLALSKEWLAGGPPPVASPDSRILFVYGQGVPTVVCAILQVCELDLEPGEMPVKDALDWGDHRFEVATRSAGSGLQQFTYLVFKPQLPGLDTTLTIGTTKRPYYVRLVSTGEEHMTRVAFTYPEEAEARRKAEAEAKKMHDDWQKAEAAKLVQLNTQKPVRNWAYSVKLHGKDAHYLRPEKIGDDGVHTYISLTEEARHRGLPVVQISDARGPIPANARWQNDQLIIDAVFEQACLLEGVGKKQQRACITNKGLQSTGGAR